GIITYSDIIRKLEEEFFKVHTTIDSVTTKEILKVAPGDTLKSAICKMTAGKKSCILVVSEESTIGILTERDIVKLLTKKVPGDSPVRDVCTKNIIYVNCNTLLYDAIKIMNERGIRHLVVVDDRLQLKGIVTQTDIINLLHENITKGIKDQLQRFKESLDMLQTGFIEFELNDDGTILYVNRRGARDLGFDSVESAVGMSFVQLLKNREQWSEFIKLANSKPVVTTFMFNLESKVIDGSFRMRKSAANGIFKDITDRFIETEYIKSERNRFENIVKTLSEGLVIYDREGTIKEINRTALDIFGMTKDETVGKPYYSLKIAVMDETGCVLDTDNLCVSRVIERRIAIKNVIRGIRKADGSITWVTASITPAVNEENEMEEIVHVLTDITELYNLEKRNQKVLETAKEGYWEVGLDGMILKINRSLSIFLGYREEELIGKKIYELVDEKNKLVFEHALERRKEGIAESYEITLKHKAGSDIYAIVSASPMADPSGRVIGAFAFITDVTDLKSTHNTLNTIASFYKDLTRALTEDEANEILKHYLLLLGKGGSRIDAVYLLNIDDDRKHVEDVIKLNESGLQENEFPGLDKCKTYIYAGNFVINDLSKEYACPYQRLAAKSGSYYCFAVNIGGSIMGILHLYSKSPGFFTEDVRETIDSFIALFAPVVNNMRLLELNKKLAIIDPLTGLYNRRYFEVFMEKQLAIAGRNAQAVSLIMLDIDNFKDFNDTYGHGAGDMALRGISHAIGKNIRSSDIGVRYGGEEFTIALPNTDKTTAFEVAERIRTAIEAIPFTMGPGGRAAITASFGIATYSMDADNLSALIAKADDALYNAKKAGKNKICLA
ncbi:MAG: diguanylate cyclase, partial [Nitrospirae bacterium]|nr:diguanylate cyclase [Nitrospirota bacterium]